MFCSSRKPTMKIIYIHASFSHHIQVQMISKMILNYEVECGWCLDQADRFYCFNIQLKLPMILWRRLLAFLMCSWFSFSKISNHTSDIFRTFQTGSEYVACLFEWYLHVTICIFARILTSTWKSNNRMNSKIISLEITITTTIIVSNPEKIYEFLFSLESSCLNVFHNPFNRNDDCKKKNFMTLLRFRSLMRFFFFFK